MVTSLGDQLGLQARVTAPGFSMLALPWAYIKSMVDSRKGESKKAENKNQMKLMAIPGASTVTSTVLRMSEQ